MRLLLLACVGCGRIDFAPVVDAPSSVDAPAMMCWDAWMNGAPVLAPATRVTEIDDIGIDHDMSITADGRQLYFSSDRSPRLGADDIFVATRVNATGPFTQVDHVPSLSSDVADGAFFTRDGLTGVLASERLGGEGSSDVWFASRAALDQPFALSNMNLGNVNTVLADYDTWLSVDGLRLYYSSASVLVQSARADLTAPWSIPVQIPGLAASAEYDPSLSPDERVIVFTSLITPGRDVYVAVRADRSVAFETPVPLDAINTTNAEFDPHISPDGCSVYFASDRDTGGGGSLEIYVASVVP